MARNPREEAAELARALDLDVYEVGICHACLSFVSFAIDKGYEPAIRGATIQWSRILWDEGLALPVQAALERARRRGVPRAEEAIADVARAGPNSRYVRAIVRHLAGELSRRTREDLERAGLLTPEAQVLEFPRGRP